MEKHQLTKTEHRIQWKCRKIKTHQQHTRVRQRLSYTSVVSSIVRVAKYFQTNESNQIHEYSPIKLKKIYLLKPFF